MAFPEDHVSEGAAPAPEARSRTFSREDVTFWSDDVACEAWLYRPDDVPSAPCVIIAHGFDGVRDQRLDAYAECFVKAGIAAFVFDYRYYGDSQGLPRQLVSNRAQLDDWRSAIECVGQLRGIDRGRIALWGTSTSAGHVIKLAAEDPRIAAVVVQMPLVDGLAQFRMMPLTQSLRLLWAGLKDQVRAWLGLSTPTIPAAGRPYSLAVVTTPDGLSGLDAITPAVTTWRNEVLPRFTLTTTFYRPGRAARRVKCPVLVCLADADRLIPAKPAIALAKRVERGALRRYRFSHFGMYHGTGFERVVPDQVEFLSEHLADPQPLRVV
jgi:dienelactone hydrolase